MENDSERAAARAHLAALLPRVMADGKLDEGEKQESLGERHRGKTSWLNEVE